MNAAKCVCPFCGHPKIGIIAHKKGQNEFNWIQAYCAGCDAHGPKKPTTNEAFYCFVKLQNELEVEDEDSDDA